MIIDNENYNLIKLQIKENNIENLDLVFALSGAKLFGEFIIADKNKKNAESITSLMFQTYTMSIMILKLYGDPEIEAEDLDKLANMLNQNLQKMEELMYPKSTIIQKGHLKLVHSR